MPEPIVVSAPPLPATPGTPSGRPAATSSDGTTVPAGPAGPAQLGPDGSPTQANGQVKDSFATVLQRQLAQATPAQSSAAPVAIVVGAAADPTTAAPTKPPGDGLGSLLPQVLPGAPSTDTSAPNSKASQKKKDAASDAVLQLAVLPAGIPISVPTNALGTTAPAQTPTGASAKPQIAISSGLPDQIPAGLPDPTPAGTQNQTPAGLPDPTPAGTQNQTPAGLPGQTPAGTQNQTPVGLRGQTPVGTPIQTPAGLPGQAMPAPQTAEIPTDPSAKTPTAVAVGLPTSAPTTKTETPKAQAESAPQALAGLTTTADKPSAGTSSSDKQALHNLATALNLAADGAKDANGSAAAKSQTPAISAVLPAQGGETKPNHAGPNASSNAPVDGLLASGQAAANTHAAAAAAPASLPIKVDTPVAAPGWDGEVADKVVWMVGHQQQRAELVLNPPTLGRVEVQLSLSGHHANASFSSANPAVRDALQAAMPRLRETFANAGVFLGQASVGAESSNHQYANRRESGDNSRRGSGTTAVSGVGLARQARVAVPWLRRGNGMVDVFA